MNGLFPSIAKKVLTTTQNAVSSWAPPTPEAPQQDTGLLAPTTGGVTVQPSIEPSTLSTPQATATPQQVDTVEQRLTDLLNKDNPYMQSARTGAMQTAESMGLTNSTMAATAGEKAAIESALPIAQQDASYQQQRGLAEQQGQIQQGLYQTQGDISKELSSQQYQQEAALKQADMDWNKIDLQARMEVEYDRLDHEKKLNFDSTAKSIGEDYMKDYLELMINPNITSAEDRQKAIDILAANTKQRYAVAAAIAGVDLEWSVPAQAVSVEQGGTDTTIQESQGANNNVNGNPQPTTMPPGPGFVWDGHKWVFDNTAYSEANQGA